MMVRIRNGPNGLPESRRLRGLRMGCEIGDGVAFQMSIVAG